jgi:MFS family permease
MFSKFRPYIVLFAASLMYLYEFVLRAMPSTMVPELSAQFHLTLEGVSLLSALYYYGYFAMQIPAGLLYDYIGPRLILSFGIFITGLCTILFGLTQHIFLADTVRLITGIVTSTAFIGALVIASHWFKPERFAMLSGFVQFLGSMGAVVGLTPVAELNAAVGWQNAILIIGISGIALSAVVFSIVRNYPSKMKVIEEKQKKQTTWPMLLENAKHILGKSQTWFIAIAAFSTWSPIVIFAALWGDPFLTDHYGVSRLQAATDISIVWIAIAISSPLMGFWSNWIQSRKIPLLLCFVSSIVSSLFILLLSSITTFWLILLLVFFGMAAGGQVITFGLVHDINIRSMIGTAVGINNMAVIAGGVVLQPLVGVLLKHFGVKPQLHLLPGTEHVFQNVLLIMPLVSLIGLLATLFFIKETHGFSVVNETIEK